MLRFIIITILTILQYASSQYEFISKKQELEYTLQEEELRNKIEIDITSKSKPSKNNPKNSDYRIDIPSRTREYAITMLVNPCGCNSTSVNKISKALGYDCCMNHFGEGQYGRLKRETRAFQKLYKDYRIGVSDRNVLASYDEIRNNIDIVDEYGDEIAPESCRRADDHLVIDEDCIGLRDPFDYCIGERMKAVKSELLAPCMDNNETVDATMSCFTPDGKKEANCMQFGYGQNAFVHTCEGEAQADCGTFVEVHIPNGSVLDEEKDSLSEAKLTTRATNGVVTSTISLRYKNDPRKILCNVIETKIRIGSMVVITDRVPECCCPMSYIPHRKVGSLFCPKKKRSKGGPFAATITSLEEMLEDDNFQLQYPYCPYEDYADKQPDSLMCSKQALGGFTEYIIGLNDNNNPTSGRFYTYPCKSLVYNETTKLYSSYDLSGHYEQKCQLQDSLFNACSLMPGTEKCVGDDVRFTFAGEIGKVVSMPDENHVDTNIDTASSIDESRKNKYGITFNDGRTVYYFYKYEIELINYDYSHELWFVQRNRFENIIKKKKPFRILWPPCTFDSVNDNYLPYAIVDDNGTVQSVS